MIHTLRPLFRPLTGSLTCLALAGMLLAGASAHGQPAGITVSAAGEATVMPDLLVLEGKLSESAELAEDALVAFQDSRRRALASLEQLEVEGLEVVPGAIRLSRGGEMGGGMGMMIGGMEPGEQVPPGQIAISQSVTIRVAGVDTMDPDDLIDLILVVSNAAKDAGIAVGEMTQQDMLMMQMGQGAPSASLATLRVSDPDAAERESAANAIAQARAKAQRLADLAGVTLGPVTAISEGDTAGDAPKANGYMAMIWGLASGEAGEDALSSSAIEPITVRTTLTVTFAIGE